MASREPQGEALPAPWGERLSPFQRLAVLRCLRPDKLVPAVHGYVVETLGPRYVEPQEFQLQPIYEDSQPGVPLIFVLSPGADPMADLLRFAEAKARRVEAVSLGQGQGPVAEAAVRDAMAGGYWVVLQNCHLAKSFLPRCVTPRSRACTLCGA